MLIRPWRLWNESDSLPRAVAVGYGLTAVVAFCDACRMVRGVIMEHCEAGPVVLWCLIGVAFAFLSADRLLGILPRFSAFTRGLLRSEGLYWGWRRPMQITATLAVLFVGLIAISIPFALPESRSFPRLAAWYVTVAVGCMVVLRSVSLHELDRWLYRRTLLGLPNGFLAEFAAITSVILCGITG